MLAAHAAAPIDVLVTHGPCLGVGDGGHVGDEHLLRALVAMEPSPCAHVSGHVHGAAGVRRLAGRRTLFINASSCNQKARPARTGARWDLEG